MTSTRENVLFACVHNAGRSLMAAAFFNQLADPKKARAVSAGTQPGTRVRSEVVMVMREVGVDLSTDPAPPHAGGRHWHTVAGHDGLRRVLPGRTGRAT